jgi:glutaminyl-peptide cyclotransferase
MKLFGAHRYKKYNRSLFATPALLLLCFGPASSQSTGNADSFRIIQSYPHDPRAFTEGLVYADGVLYESTGMKGHSTLRLIDPKTGIITRHIDVPDIYFGEGITVWQNELIQLTWQDHIGFVYDRNTLRLLQTFHIDGEGWGLTQDGRSLIMSDGTPTLHFLDPHTFRETRHLQVTENGTPVQNVNELEYIHGEIFANIWHSDRIIRISPQNGKVLGWLDLSTLLPASQRTDPEAVLNGIAYNAKTNHLFLTGKLWPRLFEIELLDRRHLP